VGGGVAAKLTRKEDRLATRNFAARLLKMPLAVTTSLTYPKCSGEMKVISVIEDEEVIKKILKHLGLWYKKARPPNRSKKSSRVMEPFMDYKARPGAIHLHFAGKL